MDGIILKKYLTSKEKKEVAYNILVKFVEFCEKNNLYYTLSGGTLLGAIRHKGFIPWDDDIDVNMPRKDFEKLRELLVEEKISDNISFSDINDENNFYPFIKLYDNRTEQKMEDGNGVIGIWIDIFPVDSIPENKSEQAKLIRKARFWRAAVISLNSNLKNSKGIIKNIGKAFFKFVSIFVGKKYFVIKANENSQKFENEKTNLVGGILWGYGSGEILTKDEYFNCEKFQFRDRYFNAPKGWEKYLTGLYGDYMQLPPKEKQVSHNTKAWWKIGE